MTERHPTTASDSTADSVATLSVAVGVVLLVLIGFAASYATLRNLAVSAGRFSPWLAPVVPLSFDLGIVVLSLKVVLAAKQGRSAMWLRLLVAGLSAATVAANASAAPTVIGRLLHAVPSAMFVICFESVTATARRDGVRFAARGRTIPRIRPLLLLLAPLQTSRSWRRAVLDEGRPAEPARAGATDRPAAVMGEPTGVTSALRRETTGVAGLPARTAGGRSSRGGDDRLRQAQQELRANPDLSAAALADALRAHGRACSVRTAQRVKAQALLALAQSGCASSG